jgi:hypothetical protein
VQKFIRSYLTKTTSSTSFILKIKAQKIGKFDCLLEINIYIVTKCQNTRKLCMFHQHGLIT